MIQIRQATTQADFDDVRHFYRTFADWLRQTYPEILQLFAPFFTQLATEAASLPGIYAPPTGYLLLATYNDKRAGTVGLTDKGEKRCEMTRMFVDSLFRGKKIGRALAEAIIIEARERGYVTMELATGQRHYAAKSLYKALGFKVVRQGLGNNEVPEDLPEDLRGGAIWIELEL